MGSKPPGVRKAPFFGHRSQGRARLSKRRRARRARAPRSRRRTRAPIANFAIATSKSKRAEFENSNTRGARSYSAARVGERRGRFASPLARARRRLTDARGEAPRRMRIVLRLPAEVTGLTAAHALAGAAVLGEAAAARIRLIERHPRPRLFVDAWRVTRRAAVAAKSLHRRRLPLPRGWVHAPVPIMRQNATAAG